MCAPSAGVCRRATRRSRDRVRRWLAACIRQEIGAVTRQLRQVFSEEEQRRRLREVIDAAGASRDLDWISIDPLVPMGTRRRTVLGRPAPRVSSGATARDSCCAS